MKAVTITPLFHVMSHFNEGFVNSSLALTIDILRWNVFSIHLISWALTFQVWFLILFYFINGHKNNE